ncbi:hypothetical protein ACA910_008541 [Epithemia clementina (nom. ined.)]
MYVNAKDCALDWIDYAAAEANRTGKVALFFMLHAVFYKDSGKSALGTGGVGEYYNSNNLENYTSQWNDPVNSPYEPLYNKFKEVAFTYKDINFQIVHSDGHQWESTRFNPAANNDGKHITSHHNMKIHQTEGASRALTMYTRFTVDPAKFQPIAAKEEWSLEAYKREPYGHSWIPYSAPYKY